VEINRRQWLAGVGASLGTAAIGCGADPGATTSPDAAPVDAIDPDATPPPNACTATSTLTPRELLAGIDTIVVLCMENRSFDHYFGSLSLVEHRTGLDGLTGVESNSDPAGLVIPAHLLESFTPADPPHGWDSCHEQWNGGLNDGFVRAHAGADQADVMGYHVRAQLPIAYALADQAALCQRWFAATLGPTWPNRFFLHCGTSHGVKDNLPSLGLRSIWDRLDEAGVANRNYYHDVAWATGGFGKTSGLASIDQFFADAAAGNLPPFSIVDPAFFGGGANDDHPSHDVRMGQALIASVVAAVGSSPQWSRSLVIVTYDEHGGFYDHVAPPAPPNGSEQLPDWQRYGFRVPSLVIGPTVRRGCTIDTVLEHGSIAKTASIRYGLDALTARSALAPDLSPCIDPRLLDDPQPPPVLPPIAMSLRALADRQARMRGHVAHPELARLLRSDPDPVVRRVLGYGERLGVVTLTD
jgi:phospholipase C